MNAGTLFLIRICIHSFIDSVNYIRSLTVRECHRLQENADMTCIQMSHDCVKLLFLVFTLDNSYLLFSRQSDPRIGREEKFKSRGASINSVEETIRMTRRSLSSGSFRHNRLSWKFEVAIENCFWSACFLTRLHGLDACMLEKITLTYAQA